MRYRAEDVVSTAGIHRRGDRHTGARHRRDDAVFTVVNGVLLRPLPYGDPDRLVHPAQRPQRTVWRVFSPPNIRDARQKSGVFSDAAAIDPSSLNLTGNGDPQQLAGAKSRTLLYRARRDAAMRTAHSSRPMGARARRRGRHQRRIVAPPFGARPTIVGTDSAARRRALHGDRRRPPELTFPVALTTGARSCSQPTS